MPPLKQKTTELFFPPNEATKSSDTSHAPESLIRWLASHLTYLCLLLWVFAKFTACITVLLYIVVDMGYIPPHLFEPSLLVRGSTRLHAVVSCRYSLHQLEQRLRKMESRLDSIDYSLAPLPATQLDSFSSRLEATETHVQSIFTLLEGAQPRNVALWADGARHLKALTSLTYEAEPNGFLRYIWGANDITIPPSHVLSGAPTSYCWEFTGSKGQFATRLSEPSLITSLSIFHAHRRTLSSAAASKAPKAFTLWGLYPDTTLVPSGTMSKRVSDLLTIPKLPPGLRRNDRLISLVNGTYDQVSTRTRQYFNISSSLSPVDVVVFVLEILSNWGSNTTCLYGLGVHVEFGG